MFSVHINNKALLQKDFQSLEYIYGRMCTVPLIATTTIYAEAFIMAHSKEEAYDLDNAMDGGDFSEIIGDWSIEVENSECLVVV